jgi:hypothetical protein
VQGTGSVVGSGPASDSVPASAAPESPAPASTRSTVQRPVTQLVPSRQSRSSAQASRQRPSSQSSPSSQSRELVHRSPSVGTQAGGTRLSSQRVPAKQPLVSHVLRHSPLTQPSGTGQSLVRPQTSTSGIVQLPRPASSRTHTLPTAQSRPVAHSRRHLPRRHTSGAPHWLLSSHCSPMVRRGSGGLQAMPRRSVVASTILITARRSITGAGRRPDPSRHGCGRREVRGCDVGPRPLPTGSGTGTVRARRAPDGSSPSDRRSSRQHGLRITSWSGSTSPCAGHRWRVEPRSARIRSTSSFPAGCLRLLERTELADAPNDTPRPAHVGPVPGSRDRVEQARAVDARHPRHPPGIADVEVHGAAGRAVADGWISVRTNSTPRVSTAGRTATALVAEGAPHHLTFVGNEGARSSPAASGVRASA